MNLSEQSAFDICPKCGHRSEISKIESNTYRCLQCDQELAHIDFTATGNIRGIFGWIKKNGDLIGGRYEVKTVLGKGGAGPHILSKINALKENIGH